MAENIPTIQGLEAQFGSWNPMAYIKASDYSGLADQFREEEYKRQQNTVQEGVLRNQQSAAMNPMFLEQQGYANRTAKQSADTGALTLERAQANQQNVLSQDQRKAALSLQDDDIAAVEKSITQALLNGTPAQKAEAMKAQQWIPAIMAERRTAADKLRLAQEQTNSHIGGIKQQGQNTLDLNAVKRFAPGKGAGQVRTIEDSVRAGKMSPAQAAVAFSGAANFEEDDEKAAMYMQLAQQYELLAKQLPLANKAGTTDMGTVTGLPQRETTPSSLELAQRRKAQGPVQMTEQDNAALAWANANPSDPRAAKIKQKLGK